MGDVIGKGVKLIENLNNSPLLLNIRQDNLNHIELSNGKAWLSPRRLILVQIHSRQQMKCETRNHNIQALRHHRMLGGVALTVIIGHIAAKSALPTDEQVPSAAIRLRNITPNSVPSKAREWALVRTEGADVSCWNMGTSFHFDHFAKNDNPLKIT
ncbi:MAG: hypothetical protein Q4B35_05285 [Slackia sp.]|nr:hypothetical protein [Slackia sp.]